MTPQPVKISLGELFYSRWAEERTGRFLPEATPWSSLTKAERAAVEDSIAVVADAVREESGAKPAKAVIVTETPSGAGTPVERRYTATQWDDSDPRRLRILLHGHPVASYQQYAYLSVREAEAAVSADEDGKGCRCYQDNDVPVCYQDNDVPVHEHDSDEDGDCRICGCGQYRAPGDEDEPAVPDGVDPFTLGGDPVDEPGTPSAAVPFELRGCLDDDSGDGL
jgi:hypothetical protein